MTRRDVFNSRGQRVGQDSYIGQNEERSRAARELSFQQNLNPTRLVTDTYTAKPWDLVLVTPGSDGATVNLPPTRTADGSELSVTNFSNSANAITINCADGDTLNGDTTASILAAWESIRIQAVFRERAWVPV